MDRTPCWAERVVLRIRCHDHNISYNYMTCATSCGYSLMFQCEILGNYTKLNKMLSVFPLKLSLIFLFFFFGKRGGGGGGGVRDYVPRSYFIFYLTYDPNRVNGIDSRTIPLLFGRLQTRICVVKNSLKIIHIIVSIL